MDYQRKLEFGISVVPETLAQTRVLVHTADVNGVDLVGIQDHPYQRRFFDTWMLMATLLAQTEHVRIFPDVANLPLRPPTMIAKEAASLDVLSGGRFEVGIGAGGFWDAIEAMGGPRRSPGEEAIAIIRQAWSEVRSVQFEGKHYRAHGYHPGPRPAHNIEIWIGAYRPRMLGLTGRIADGWLPSLGRLTVDDIAAMQKLIDEGAREAGRDPSEIRRMLNVTGAIGEQPADGEGLTGPADYWVETLTTWASEIGIDTFVLWPSIPDEQQVHIWGTEVAPRVRAEVAARRN
jgi:alkanesulfonate monooxygenase SsuD/methylene tetrahydromethanopterin reductase-like flavin-dependent oxidoreductase (luciferase family)